MSASTASRPPNGRINVHEPSDYPIVLGDSLKTGSTVQSQFLRMRYNWEPRQGFAGQRGTLKRSDGRLRVTYRDGESESSVYDYSATLASDSTYSGGGEDQPTRLALIFDPTKSVYVLEQISKSFNLNLISAHDQSQEEVKRHKQIAKSPSDGRASHVNGGDEQTENDDEDADPSNPFDFRHFLSEAKENAEKALQPPGNRTPVPGSRTPMNGISSPSLGPNRLHTTTTSQFRPTTTSVPASKKPVSTKPTAPSVPKEKKVVKRKPAVPKPRAAPQLSSEVVSDSSDDDDDGAQNTVNVTRLAPSQAKDQSDDPHGSSASIDRSPHIMVNDGGLEIDMGSPPPDRKPRATLDIEAFRSQTHTPTWGHGANKRSVPQSDRDIDMRDGSDEEDQDDDDDADEDNEVRPRPDEDMDEDVDDFRLNHSPHPKRADETVEETEKVPSPPTPLPPRLPEEDEDEDLLAAELMAALGEDESEVSEEE